MCNVITGGFGVRRLALVTVEHLLIVASIVGGVLMQMILGILLRNVPALSQVIEGSKLRLVVFAVTLVILMLLRPQGMFAHHEFSWSFIKKLLGKKDVPKTAVSA